LQAIFQRYARDLEAVQAQYEAQKHAPPVPHNVPPTAGNIMWARHLLVRIEEPMHRFAQNKGLMASKESKKVIKLYNKVGAGWEGAGVGVSAKARCVILQACLCHFSHVPPLCCGCPHLCVTGGQDAGGV
jgi:hypothetical protein